MFLLILLVGMRYEVCSLSVLWMSQFRLFSEDQTITVEMFGWGYFFRLKKLRWISLPFHSYTFFLIMLVIQIKISLLPSESKTCRGEDVLTQRKMQHFILLLEGTKWHLTSNTSMPSKVSWITVCIIIIKLSFKCHLAICHLFVICVWPRSWYLHLCSIWKRRLSGGIQRWTDNQARMWEETESLPWPPQSLYVWVPFQWKTVVVRTNVNMLILIIIALCAEHKFLSQANLPCLSL